MKSDSRKKSQMEKRSVPQGTLPDNKENNKNGMIPIFIIIFIAFIISFLYIFDSKLDLNGDNFSYLTLAKGIADGKGYTEIYYPGTPPANHFPPGYPAILSFFMFFGINSISFFKILNGLFLFGSVILFSILAKKITNNKSLVLSFAILFVINSGLLSYATIIMSEMPYLFFSCLTFYLIYKLAERTDFWRSPYFYILCIASIATFYIRAFGVVMIISVLIYFLLKKQWKLSFAYLLGNGLLYLPWDIRNRLLGSSRPYIETILVKNPWRPEEGQVSTLSDFFNKIIANFDETIIKGFKEVLFPFLSIDYSTASTIPAIIFTVILLAIIFYGAWQTGKFRFLFIFYILGNIGVLLLWNGGNGARYVHPLTPFILFCLLWGVFSLLKKIKVLQAYQKFIPYSFLILALLMLKPITVLHQRAVSPYPANYANFFAIAKNVKKNPKLKIKGKPLIICCRKPNMFSYYADCISTNYMYSTDPKKVIQNLIDNDVDYVVLEQLGYSSTGLYLYPAITAYPDWFIPVMHIPNPDTVLLLFDKEKAKTGL